MTTVQQPQARGSFWAVALLGIGIIWLLVQLNVFSLESLAMLGRIWPIILIALGVNLLFARGNPALSRIIAAAALVLILALMLIGPALGWAGQVDVQQQTFTAALDDADSADINLNLSVGTTRVEASDDGEFLFAADVRYTGDMNFDVSGDRERVVRLSNQMNNSFVFPGFDFGSRGDDALRWDVTLAPDVPMAVHITGGLGNSDIDLSGIELTRMDMNIGVGDLNLTLPAGVYSTSITGGVGSADIRLEDGAATRLSINAGVGDIRLDVPDDAPVRVTVTGGLGSVTLPDELTRVSGRDREGVWESATFAEASDDERVIIDYTGGVSSLTLR